MKMFPVFLVLLLAGCVHVDPQTGESLPRGDQKYKFAAVERRAEMLRDGMTRIEAQVVLGSPATTRADGSVWIYLPERPAVLLPGRALRLVFEDNALARHGYRTVLFGKVF